MINEKLLDNFFRGLTLFFWSIVWYRWVAISIESIQLTLVTLFSFLSLLYIILISLSYKKNTISKIDLLYKISTLLAFISTLFSFVLFSKSYFYLYLKIFFVLIYFYCSCIKVYKYNTDEGIVGILASLLLIVLTLLY